MHHIEKKLFCEYDIRGEYPNPLSTDAAFQIGRAISTVAIANHQNTIVVGRDGRLSSPALFQALVNGMNQSGINVVDVGMVPTPVLYFASHLLNISSYVMITGSHNPSSYNGFKIAIHHQPQYGKNIKHLYDIISNQSFSAGDGNCKSVSVLDQYIDKILRQYPHHGCKSLKIVLDCCHGMASLVAPQLYQLLGHNIITLYDDVDGNFPSHPPDPSHPVNLRILVDKVKTLQADLGIAFDGDADRLMVVDDQGDIIKSDRLLMLIAQDILSHHPDTPVGYDIKCSMAVKSWIESHRGNPCLWHTGHSIFKTNMQKSGALLSGEFSGHIYIKDRWYGFDDGIYVATRVFELLSKSNHTLSQMMGSIPNYPSTPEIDISINLHDKKRIVEKFIDEIKQDNKNIQDIFTFDGVKVIYPAGWGLLRSSKTNPKLTLRFEAKNKTLLSNIVLDFKRVLHRIDPHLNFQVPL